MPGRELTEDDLKWLEEYRTQVIEAFTPIFSEAADRFSDGELFFDRFQTDALRRQLELESIDASFIPAQELR